MFVVLFEVQPKRAQWDRYLELAEMLRPELLRVRGFIDNERYSSERTEGKLLSLSTWEDEKALIRWRTQARHHDVQGQGRFEVFEDYHLRVGEVLSDSDEEDLRHSRLDVTEIGATAAVTVTETFADEKMSLPRPSEDLLDAESYSGITVVGKRLTLACWLSEEAADVWIQSQPARARRRHVRVIRDYGMHRREEAPQYFPAMNAVSDVGE
jgi:heme-degrading monooxygenase HmoA